MYFDWNSLKKLGHDCGCNCNTSNSCTKSNASNSYKGRNIGDFMLTFSKIAQHKKAMSDAQKLSDKYGFFNPFKQNSCNCKCNGGTFQDVLNRRDNYYKNNPPPPPPKNNCGCHHRNEWCC